MSPMRRSLAIIDPTRWWHTGDDRARLKHLDDGRNGPAARRTDMAHDLPLCGRSVLRPDGRAIGPSIVPIIDTGARFKSP
jgi:hypothetical protein